MSEQLTAETREAICAIKDSYWRRAEYRDTVTSEHIYRAVLDSGVRGIDEFEQRLASRRTN